MYDVSRGKHLCENIKIFSSEIKIQPLYLRVLKSML